MELSSRNFVWAAPMIAFVVSLLVPLGVAAQPSSLPDPGAQGPFAIGHTRFLVVDTSRNTNSTFGGRPVGVNVWYPVDPGDITNESPEGLYKFDPIYPQPPNSFFTDTTSSVWEHPCDHLPGPPDPALKALCDARTVAFPKTYEGIAPSSGKPFPLVVFSPGLSNRTIVYSFFAERLASHGFVVAVAQHYRDGYVAWDPLDPFSTAMFNRTRDVSFMLDALLARNSDSSNLLYGSIQPDLVAAAGHSIGGYATLALAGGDDDICVETKDTDPMPTICTRIADGNGNPIPTFPDQRIKAIVTLDPGNLMLHFRELARITVPSLTIGQPVETAGVRFPARPHAASSADIKYRADVRGALHTSFTNSCTGIWVAYDYGFFARSAVLNQMNQPQCATALPQGEVNRLAAKYAIAFLKTVLTGQPGFQDILTPGHALNAEANIEFFVTEPTSEDPTMFLYFPHQLGGGRPRGGPALDGGQCINPSCTIERAPKDITPENDPAVFIAFQADSDF